MLNDALIPELDLDRVFHALADPSRRNMLDRLSQGPASVSELGKPLAMSLAAVLQHVQILEASGIVQSRKLGRTRTCSLNATTLRSASMVVSYSLLPYSSVRVRAVSVSQGRVSRPRARGLQGITAIPSAVHSGIISRSSSRYSRL